ncbi:hypothetical protein [Streptomyces sp. Go-475]|uniref:hypothetical protein n=1 Tax=Streptomyces sp. Go-475 TaxID=2072505 RepID=UPI000DEECC61|nr:hypothetical protein [Streptomyces sp. Go-475]AXE89337.1 hypothetical protein C1703_30410 [Streptomyces sp. Go-475]
MNERTLVGIGAVIIGIMLMLGSQALARRSMKNENVFGRANREKPAMARVMPVVVGAGMTLCGVLVLTGVLGVQ